MATYIKKDFEGSKINLIQKIKSKNELSTDANVALTKSNFPVSESANKIELSSEINFSAFWVEFSALVSELETLATEIKALDD